MKDKDYEELKAETVKACEQAIKTAAGATTAHDLGALSVGLLAAMCTLQVQIIGELRSIKQGGIHATVYQSENL